MSDYPFALVDFEGDKVLRGCTPNAPLYNLSADAVKTYFCVVANRSFPTSGDVVMTTEATIVPPVGAVIQLTEPNRDATVMSVIFQFYADGTFATMIYLDDPAVTAP